MRRKKSDELIRAIEILGLTPPFSLLDIKKAYKERAKELHPDRATRRSGGEEEMRKVNGAYHILLKQFEQLKVPLDLFLASSQSDEERIRNRFYYDWMPPKDEEVETV